MPKITVTPASPQFTGKVGGAFPASLALKIVTSNGKPWATHDISPWFDASPTSGKSGASTTLKPHTDGLTAGTYRQIIRVTADGCPELNVMVTLVLTAVVVPPVGVITTNPTNPKLTGVVGGANPANLNLVITTSNGQPWSTHDTSPWFDISPTTGASGTPAILKPKTAGMTAGSYTQPITVSASGLPDLTVNVALELTTGTPTPNPPPTFLIEGFGKNTIGGAGGPVLLVTNLNDGGPGSFREAIERSGPRIIKFRVSGNIGLQTPIQVTQGFLTIDGSDAPGGGICLKGAMLSLTANNLIVRYIRERSGNGDAIQIYNSRDVVIDHCSLSWGTDENLDLASQNVTIQWCIISENMGTGGLLMNYGANPTTTLHHNLFAHNGGARHPELGIGEVDFVNNVIYNYYNYGTTQIDPGCGGCGGGGPIHANIVGNFYKPGIRSTKPPAYSNEIRLNGHTPSIAAQSAIYVQGNISPNRPNDSMSQLANVWQDNGGVPLAPSRFPYPQVTTSSANQAYTDVLANAGARLPKLDAVDQRIIRDVQNVSGDFIGNPSEVGGWPDLS